jgi:sugar lactone lactonase YvrE
MKTWLLCGLLLWGALGCGAASSGSEAEEGAAPDVGNGEPLDTGGGEGGQPGDDTGGSDPDVSSGDAQGSDDTGGTPDAGGAEDADGGEGGEADASACVDPDGDGYGDNCALGPDCDPDNPNFTTECPNCAFGAFPGCPCSGAETKSCYESDPALLGKGVCLPGSTTCTDGWFGPCVGQVLPSPEICDTLDNDCNGQTDEEVLSTCGNCDSNCKIEALGSGTGNNFPVNAQNSQDVEKSKLGYLKLVDSKLNAPHIWIANSQESTVSKLHTSTGDELGRYTVCFDPSRTAVDLLGDVYVGCRGEGKVAKIAGDLARCVDKNGNGSIDTSTDKDGDAQISPSEMVKNDECILYIRYPNGLTDTGPVRGVAVDLDNNVWLGTNGTMYAYQLDGETGEVLNVVNTSIDPYGFAVDGDGSIWISSLGSGALGRIDTTKPEMPFTAYAPSNGECFSPYGIAVDAIGRVWLGNFGCNNAIFFDPATEKWTSVDLGGNFGPTRGVAASNDGFVYVAHHGGGCGFGGGNVDGRHVSRVNIETLEVFQLELSKTQVKGPVGVAIDSQGYLWSVNQCTNTAIRFASGKGVIGEYPVGTGPYTYSDMTGYSVFNLTVPYGTYRATFGGKPNMQYEWDTLDLVAETPAGTSVSVLVRAADTKEALEAATWSEPLVVLPGSQLPVDVSFAKGSFFEILVELGTAKKTATPLVKSIFVKYREVPVD